MTTDEWIASSDAKYARDREAMRRWAAEDRAAEDAKESEGK